MVAVASVIVVVILSVIVSRVATVALTVTGLSRESARFQARSALTGAGFTTSESEKVVDHPVRRRIIATLMLTGSAGIVTIIASLMLSFVNAGGANAVVRLGVLIGALVVVLLLARNDRVDQWLTRTIARLLREYTDLDTRDYARLLKLSGDYAITELQVRDGDWLATGQLADLELTDEGVIVLGIQRADGSYVGAPRGSAAVHPGDTVIAYGRSRRLAELDERRRGWIGESAHAQAVQEQQFVETVEQATDPGRDQESGVSS